MNKTKNIELQEINKVIEVLTATVNQYKTFKI